MRELGVSIAEEGDSVTTGVVFNRISSVRITFLADTLLRFDDDAAEQTGLILMLGDEFRGQNRSLFFRLFMNRLLDFYNNRRFILIGLRPVIQSVFLYLRRDRCHFGNFGTDAFLGFQSCVGFAPCVKQRQLMRGEVA